MFYKAVKGAPRGQALSLCPTGWSPQSPTSLQPMGSSAPEGTRSLLE